VSWIAPCYAIEVAALLILAVPFAAMMGLCADAGAPLGIWAVGRGDSLLLSAPHTAPGRTQGVFESLQSRELSS